MKEILCKHFTSINIVERLTVHSLLKSYLSVTHRYGSKNNKERKRVDLPRRFGDRATRPKRTAMQGAQPPATKKKYRERAAAIRTLQEEFT